MSLYESALHFRDQLRVSRSMVHPASSAFKEISEMLKGLNPVISRLKIKSEIRRAEYAYQSAQNATLRTALPKEMQEQNRDEREQKASEDSVKF